MTEMTVHKDNQPIYDIVFRDSFDDLLNVLEPFAIENRRVCIVTETNVFQYYGDAVTSIIKTKAKECITFIFPEGEANKNLNTVQNLYETLILNQFDRKDLLIALGGGVVGDLTGYTAATYLRGIDFIQIPTSLLAQVDSSIGGKTGVDFHAYKNMVGAFHQPKCVYMNLSTLQTLSERQFNSGLGEIIKHGLIKDNDYYQWICDHYDDIQKRDMDTMLTMITKSCDIKRRVVEEDPTEKGDRALLNFGHTLGHAIEKLMDFQLLHGECVAIGCVLAAIISKNKGYLTMDELVKIYKSFQVFHFPDLDYNLDFGNVIATTKNDKKMVAGKIKFILLHKVGQAYIDTSITDEDMMEAMNEYASLKERLV